MSEQKAHSGLSRRSLLKYTGAASLAGLAGAIGWQFRPVTAPNFPKMNAAAEGSKPKLLVAYASMMGSTAEQAKWIADVAGKNGFSVRLCLIDDAPAPDAFDALVLGSAIRTSAWLPDMVEWCASHQAAIAAKPHLLFQGSMTAAQFYETAPNGRLAGEQEEKLVGDLRALHTAAPALVSSPVAFLPGRLEFHRMQPMHRIGYTIMSGSLLWGDYRKPDLVRSLAQDFFTTNAKAHAS